MKPVEIVTSLLSSQWAEWLADSLAFCDPEFAKVRDSFERILPSLYEKFGEQRIKELIQNEMAKQTIAMVFSSFLGLRYNLENFQSVIPLDFLNQEKDRYLKEDRLNCIPRYLKAHKVSEIAEHLGITDSSYLRKKVLENLVINGYLGKSKVSRAMFYKTKPEMVSVE